MLVLVSLACKSFQLVPILSKVVPIPNIKDLSIFHTRLFGQELFRNEIRIGIRNFSNWIRIRDLVFQIRLQLATFGCNSPNQPTRFTHILLSKSACVCDESYEKSPQANLSFGFATQSLLYQTIVNFNLFYYQVCATTIDLHSLHFYPLPHNNTNTAVLFPSGGVM